MLPIFTLRRFGLAAKRNVMAASCPARSLPEAPLKSTSPGWKSLPLALRKQAALTVPVSSKRASS